MGCRWRNADPSTAKPELWAMEGYQFWDERTKRWTEQRPEACTVRGQDLTPGWAPAWVQARFVYAQAYDPGRSDVGYGGLSSGTTRLSAGHTSAQRGATLLDQGLTLG